MRVHLSLLSMCWTIQKAVWVWSIFFPVHIVSICRIDANVQTISKCVYMCVDNAGGPAAMAKYAGDPEFMQLITKVQAKMGGMSINTLQCVSQCVMQCEMQCAAIWYSNL